MRDGRVAYRDATAANYEAQRLNEPLWSDEQAWMADYADSLTAGTVLLDIPVGTGRFLSSFSRSGLIAIGADVSADMLAQARQHNQDSAPRLVLADAISPPLASRSVDVVVCWRLLHLLPPLEVAKAIAAMAAMTRHEIVVQIYPPPRRPSILARLARILHRPPPQQPPAQPAPWSDIRTYAHSVADVVSMAGKHGFHPHRKQDFNSKGSNACVLVLRYRPG